MQVIALHTVLRAGCEEDYDRIHRVVPAPLAEALRAHGVNDWRIWREGRDVFHLVEVADYAAMRSGLRDLPVNVAWQERVRPLFEVPDDYAGADPVVPLVWRLLDQVEG